MKTVWARLINDNSSSYAKIYFQLITSLLVCNLIVIFATYVRRGGKRDEIWLNFIINLTGCLNMLRHLRYHVSICVSVRCET